MRMTKRKLFIFSITLAFVGIVSAQDNIVKPQSPEETEKLKEVTKNGKPFKIKDREKKTAISSILKIPRYNFDGAPSSKEGGDIGNFAKPETDLNGIEELCARIHTNVAFVGIQPFDFVLLKNAYECQKACITVFPRCVAIMFYSFQSKDNNENICYLFDQNSIDPNIQLIEEKSKHEGDIIRALEIVINCHQFDPFPPLEENEIVSSTDKVSINKRKTKNNTKIETTGSWTSWSSCFSPGIQTRSQTCEYGRKIQRRKCMAQTQQAASTTSLKEHISYPPQEYQDNQQNRSHGVQTRPLPLASTQSQSSINVDEKLHTAIHAYQVVQCPGNNCALPQYPVLTCRSSACSRSALGFWQPWTAWSPCSSSCGDGISLRRRFCTTSECGSGGGYETTPCNMIPCEAWSEWCDWQDCSSSCGPGKKKRTRECLLGEQLCIGKPFEVEPCDAGPCPEWSEWEDWSECSTSCGHGIQSRQRSCLGGVHGYQQCKGDKVDQLPCDHEPCSFWSMWQEWSACSVPCGDGVKRRERICQGGTDCVGESVEDIFCSGPSCAAWSIWEEWSRCSSLCGPGQKMRGRQCQSPSGKVTEDCLGDKIQVLLCYERECASWSEWCGWSQCDRDCGGGISYRTRICEAPGSSYGDYAQCPGPDRETHKCNDRPCAPQCQWTTWCPFSPCSVSSACHTGISSRTRQCVGEPSCSCRGSAEETKECKGSTPCEPPSSPISQPC